MAIKNVSPLAAKPNVDWRQDAGQTTKSLQGDAKAAGAPRAKVVELEGQRKKSAVSNAKPTGVEDEFLPIPEQPLDPVEPVPGEAAPSVYALPESEFANLVGDDLGSMRNSLNGLATLRHRIRHGDLKERVEELVRRRMNGGYRRSDRILITDLWAEFYEHIHTLEALLIRYADYESAPTETKRVVGSIIDGTVMAAQADHVLGLFDLVGSNAMAPEILDEGVPDIGIPPGLFTKMRKRVASSHQRFLFSRLGERLDATRGALDKVSAAAADPSTKGFLERMKPLLATDGQWATHLEQANVLLEQQQGGNAVSRLFHWCWEWLKLGWESFMDTIGIKIQKEVCEVLGDTRLPFEKGTMISEEQALALASRMQPGDVIVERQNLFLSNAGLPGFWPHGELYIGRPEELKAFFDADAEVKALVKRLIAHEEREARAGNRPRVDYSGVVTFTQFMAKRFPEKWKTYITPGAGLHGHDIRIIEAISEGVSFTGVEHGMKADYCGVMRPNMSKADKAVAVMRAFEYQGRPYDWNFTFDTDNELVCTELVAKALSPGGFMEKGLYLPTKRVGGRPTLPAVAIVEFFDEHYDDPEPPLGFVGFLDGDRKKHAAHFATLRAFRKSHKRSRWTLLN